MLFLANNTEFLAVYLYFFSDQSDFTLKQLGRSIIEFAWLCFVKYFKYVTLRYKIQKLSSKHSEDEKAINMKSWMDLFS